MIKLKSNTSKKTKALYTKDSDGKKRQTFTFSVAITSREPNSWRFCVFRRPDYFNLILYKAEILQPMEGKKEVDERRGQIQMKG